MVETTGTLAFRMPRSAASRPSSTSSCTAPTTSGFIFFMPRRVRFDADADPALEPADIAEIAPCFCRIAVDATDNFESGTLRNVLSDGGPDRTETEVHDANARHSREL